jgi:aldehyde:ferredoxin oxidoreductase
LRAALYVIEIINGEFQESGFEKHMGALIEKEHYLALADSLIVCKFGMRSAKCTVPVLTDLYRALTGIELTERELLLAGERIWNFERIYNLSEGIEEDMPAPRLFREDLDDGKAGGQALSMERFLKARSMYYEARGWNEKGVPTEDKLKELELNVH